MFDLPVQLDPQDFDWHRVFGHDEFMDDVLQKHAWKVKELLLALEYSDTVDSGDMDLDELWDVIQQEQECADENPEEAHPAILFAETLPEIYFMASRLLAQAVSLVQRESDDLLDLTDDLWQLSAQLAMLQMPMVGVSMMLWEDSFDLHVDLTESAQPPEAGAPGLSHAEPFPESSSPGAQRWRKVIHGFPRLSEALMRLEDLRAAYEAFVSVKTFDMHAEGLAAGLFRSCTMAHVALVQFTIPENPELR